MISVDQVIKQIHDTLINFTSVKAAWLSGSAAFNRQDEYSDIDIGVLAAEDNFKDIFAAIEASLNKLSFIEKRHVVTKRIKGCEQRFYQLENTSPFHIVDMVLIQKDAVGPFLEKNRYGIPVILFNKDNSIKPHEENTALLEKFSARLPQIKSEFTTLSRIFSRKSYCTQQIRGCCAFLSHKSSKSTHRIVKGKILSDSSGLRGALYTLGFTSRYCRANRRAICCCKF